MILRPALLVLALAAPSLTWGQALDHPERIARLSYVEGEATFQGARERETSALPDRPLIRGDRIITDRGRAELALGSATVRLDEQSELAIVDLDATAIRIELTSGSAIVNLTELFEDETFEILTPNAAVTLDEPGEYRADVFGNGSSALTVRAGHASVDTAGGTVRVAAGQRAVLDGREAMAHLESPPPPDAFDDWVLDREVLIAEMEPPRYTPFDDGDYDEYDSYDEFDRYGEWYDEPYYGRVWMPSYGYSGWSPYYGGGYWQRVGFGWSWYDPAPFGYFSYYSGRWTYLEHRHRWCWVPNRQIDSAYFARDTRQRAIPRGRIPVRVTPESAPRTADQRTVVTTPSLPRRIDEDRRPARSALPRTDNGRRPVSPPSRRIDDDRPPVRSAPPRADNERRTVRSAPPRSDTERRPVRTRADAANAAPPQRGRATERPSPPEHARSERRSEKKADKPQERREPGERHTP